MSSSVEKFQSSQWVKLEELNFSKNAVLEMLHEGAVLDIGCGDGLLIEKLQQKGLTVSGIDISSRAVELCKERNLACVQGDITEKLPYQDASFDTVLLIDVLEHLFQPKEVLKEAFRVSKKQVIISVPNFVSLPARLQVLLGRVPENNTPRDGHVYWMTLKVVRSLLAQTGFEIEDLVTNTFWERIPLLGSITRLLAQINPSLFALSFIIKAKK